MNANSPFKGCFHHCRRPGILNSLLEELTPGGKKLLPVTVLDASLVLAYSL